MLNSWTPNKRQEFFLSLPDTINEALYGGAAGGGKTEALLVLPLIKKSTEDRFLYEYPRFKALYLRRTFPELENEVIPRSNQFYKPCGFTYNGTQKRWTHPSGAIVQFGHCEHESDVTKYDTAEYNIILFDELTTFTPYQYQYLAFSRCRTSDHRLPEIVRSGTNPGGIGHAYIRKRFVEPHKDGNVILRESIDINGQLSQRQRIFVPSKVQDNQYLSASYVTSLHQLPPADRASKLDGDWWVFSGQVFDDFRVSPLNGEPSYASHVCDPFIIPYYWPRVLSIDWGYSALTVSSWYAINPVPTNQFPGKVYKYREYSERRKPISIWASDIARLSQGEEYVDVVMDPSAWQNRGQESTIIEEFIKYSGLKARKANNDRSGGKLLIQEYLRWEKRPAKRLPSGDFDVDYFLKLNRIKGPKAAADYQRDYQPDNTEEFLPKLKIFKSCYGIIDNLPKCVYVSDSGRKNEENPIGATEDVAELKNDVDDYYDELRYGLLSCKNFLEIGVSEHNHQAQIAKVYDEFSRNKNLTYLNMKLDEIESVSESKGVRRFRGSRLKYANF